MTHSTDVTEDEVAMLAKLAGLPLPDDRRKQLAGTLSLYRANFERLRRIETGDNEPPAITYDGEARS
jgi:Asp-tRNA(Asn)/Glu-tRNA(Gln) amidotransferase C subunit